MASIAQERPEQIREAFCAGRRLGFGVSALVLALVSFLSLLGAEKAILAIVLGAIAAYQNRPGTLSKRLGMAAVSIGAIFLVTWGVVLIVFWDNLVQFVTLLDKLS